jgi:hypothetical protein
MKIMVAMCLAVAVLSGTVALVSGGSSGDEIRVRNATFAASDELIDPGIRTRYSEDMPGKIGPTSLDEDACLRLDRQDAKSERYGVRTRLGMYRGYPYDVRGNLDFNNLYYRFTLLEELGLLRPHGRDVETFRDLEGIGDLRLRFLSLDLEGESYFSDTMEALDLLREKCE